MYKLIAFDDAQRNGELHHSERNTRVPEDEKFFKPQNSKFLLFHPLSTSATFMPSELVSRLSGDDQSDYHSMDDLDDPGTFSSSL